MTEMNPLQGDIVRSSDKNVLPALKVIINEEYKTVSVTCGIDSSMVLTQDGQLLCCGSNRQEN